MHEELLEDIAQKNGLREVNPYLKLAGALGAILLCLSSTSFIAPLVIGLLLSTGILLLARVDLRTYGELLAAPFSFALMGTLVIIFLSGGGEPLWSWSPLTWLSFSLTRGSINEGILVLSRVAGGMSALIFIALTTPMTDLFLVMRECRIPEPVLDLTMMIYRMIFMIMDQLVQTYQAQRMRLGYTSFRESVRSFSMLCGSVFVGSWEAGEDLVRAMDARCYSGRFAMAGEIRPVGMKSLLAVVSFLLVSSAIVLSSGSITII
ncbi:MAG: cobalt ECF transporter T component CbiQ [Methanomicrobiales archaeon]|nr:cobalt ECF transporter T component CbiQ [Methanomicrobiales archaeon]